MNEKQKVGYGKGQQIGRDQNGDGDVGTTVFFITPGKKQGGG